MWPMLVHVWLNDLCTASWPHVIYILSCYLPIACFGQVYLICVSRISRSHMSREDNLYMTVLHKSYGTLEKDIRLSNMALYNFLTHHISINIMLVTPWALLYFSLDHPALCFTGLKGNPLSPEILSIYNQSNGTQKLLSYMLDNLPSRFHFCHTAICHF